MSQIFDAAEVRKHNDESSCWVILYGSVYDVTDFLPNHPGGRKIILRLAGQNATEEYDPVHPPGTLEEYLKPEAKLGTIDPDTLPKEEAPKEEKHLDNGPPPLDSLLNLDEIEQLGSKQISRKAWAYYYSGGDDLVSKRLNNEAYRSILLRPRIFIDCEQCNTETTIIGCKVGLPIYVSPAAMARLAHPTGEAGIAKACSRFGALQMISNNASMAPEQITSDAQPGQIFAWQLYAQIDRKKSEDMLARINKIPSIKFVVLTLDAPVPGKREEDERSKNVASGLPIISAVQSRSASKPTEGGGGGIGKSLFAGTSPNLTWKNTLPWLAQHTKLPLVLKGIQTHEDAYLASLHTPQVKGIILSNHGGRALDTAPPAIHTLLEIHKYCPSVFQNLDVLVDGGIKRGTDVVKALCLGAKGVGIGRAPLWGLAAGGVEGVERTFEILSEELKTAMRLLGASRVADLNMQHINARALERQIYDGPAGFEKVGMWVSSKL
ncbi:hypothetical protein JMJ35_009205 [Cladonia borealis]|uniref:L-lactate dehydrogenase (cytochrome) n=1 Tax=Cladonia borealis TaxID=184061 RepID=A0AA39U5C4_9LECA|nr:hypothetical protein JMJ35_009205 [Cladonia borealis]